MRWTHILLSRVLIDWIPPAKAVQSKTDMKAALGGGRSTVWPHVAFASNQAHNQLDSFSVGRV